MVCYETVFASLEMLDFLREPLEPTEQVRTRETHLGLPGLLLNETRTFSS